MNKIITYISGVLLLTAMFGLTACRLNESQIKVVAQHSGLASAVTWIAYDNPDETARGLVTNTFSIVKENVSRVQEGMTYTEVIFPEFESYTRTDAVPTHYEPIVIAGGLAILNGIDLLFAMNPSWKEREGLAMGVITSFIFGAEQGLRLAKDDPVMIQIENFHHIRIHGIQERGKESVLTPCCG